MTHVGSAWDTLLTEHHPESGWHARRLVPEAPCQIQAAIHQPGRVPAVLFVVAASSIAAGTVCPDCVGFRLSPETTEPGPRGRVRLCLELRDARYRELFEVLADDIVGVVGRAANEIQGVRSLIGRLNTWQRFITRFGPGQLSEEARLGLFGELHFLEARLLPRLTADAAVQAWRGPIGEAQDFRLPRCSIEVKATTSRVPVSFRVSNLDQLDTAPDVLLLVHHLTLEIAPAGVSLPEIVERIRAPLRALDVAAVSDFDDRLRELGYLDVHAPIYAEARYRVVHERWFEVLPGFPRLTRLTVPTGILEATYAVDLAECRRYERLATDAVRLLEERLG